MTYPTFGTVLVRLPTGEGLWIDITTDGEQLADIAGTTRTFHSSFFYFVDSSTNPQLLTDYYNTAVPGRCPPNFRIRDCSIAITIKRLADGPAIIGPDVGGGDGTVFGYSDRLRDNRLALNRPIFFLSLMGTVHKVPGIKQDALLSPLVHDIARPTAIRVDSRGMDRLSKLASEAVGPQAGLTVHLRYLGGKRWSVSGYPPGQLHGRPIRDVGYRVVLDPADAQCCQSPTEPVNPRVLPTLGGEVEWRGQILRYDLEALAVRSSMYWDVLFDPSDDTVLVLGIPAVKPLWQLPAGSQ